MQYHIFPLWILILQNTNKEEYVTIPFSTVEKIRKGETPRI